ncbi:hypothetical protein [Acidiphilium cryptum]|uniref:hypothetical protein n=1 Tax=Acidiphilium cryptum TaxID=524 RepID=UPI0012DE489D|nr:hypothetical protein [Acidiphilium cryptum]
MTLRRSGWLAPAEIWLLKKLIRIDRRLHGAVRIGLTRRVRPIAAPPASAVASVD